MYFETQKLSVGYHRRPLIEDIDIGIWQGGILCLIGPNGSGKSTILRSITRHLTKLGGVVAIGGRDLDGMSDKELARHVSVVLTDRIEPELMTCWEVVAAGRYPYTNHFGKLSREDQRIVEDSMARVNALELREQRFTELSDGQKQRVLLARALCAARSLLILDEIGRGTSTFDGMAIARAVLDAIAFQVTDLVQAMNADAPCPITTLRVDGGASVSDIMMQTQADLLRLPVDRPAQVETTAFGAAALAGLAAGVWGSLEEVAALRRSQHVFLPQRPQAACETQYRLWRRAVDRALRWIENDV